MFYYMHIEWIGESMKWQCHAYHFHIVDNILHINLLDNPDGRV